MHTYKTIIFIFVLLLFTVGCSHLERCANENNYTITFSSAGGVSGIESGITVSCSGLVKFWQKKLNSVPVTTDSLELSDSQVEKFNELMANQDIFTYSYKFVGNYTSYLSLLSGNKKNRISFNRTDLPENIPSSIKQLLTELDKIKK